MAQVANLGARHLLVVDNAKLVAISFRIEEVAIYRRTIGCNSRFVGYERFVVNRLFCKFLPRVCVILIIVYHINTPEVLIHDEVEIVANPCSTARSTEEVFNI